MNRLTRFFVLLAALCALSVGCRSSSPSLNVGATQNFVLGPQGVAVYANATTLAAETGQIPPGQIVSLASPAEFLIATNVATAGQFVAKSVYTSTSGTTITTYWQPYPSDMTIGGQSSPFTVRAVTLSIAAYTGSGTGTLTASATGALTAPDGVAVVAGDQIFVPAGLTNLTAAKDSGPWVVVVPGTTGVAFVLSRPYWWFTGAKWTSGMQVRVGGEGACFENTIWRATAAAGVIDTTDPAFYVERFTFERKLVAGTLVLAAGQPTCTATSATFPAGIYSATQSNIDVSLAIPAGTLTGTVSYGPANASSSALATPGYAGTAAGAIFALATAQATQTNDASTLQITLQNF